MIVKKHLGSKMHGENSEKPGDAGMVRGDATQTEAGEAKGRTADSGAMGAEKPAAAGKTEGLEASETSALETELDEKAAEASQNDERMQEILDLTNDLQRTRADFENFRRRTEERQEAAKQAARLSTVYKLLPLIDDLGRAIESYAELAPLKKSMEKTLNELGLKPVNSKPGEEFKPDVHEAVGVEGEGEKEVISEVLREGYYYEGELLRPAMVKVRKEA